MKNFVQFRNSTKLLFNLALVLVSGAANALPVNWIDWQSSSNTNGFTAIGTIITATSTVTVTYNNPLGVGFFQDGVGAETDYWAQGGFGSLGRNPATSPYTSTGPKGADNIPTGTDIIALQFAGPQTLTFSEPIANPYFAYVSLNGNGYGFDQDFEILSFGNASDGNDIGYWGPGTSTKNVTATEFQLLGTDEPHGTLRFTGAFDTVTWRSLSNEFWNGFTVGIQGTVDEVDPCDVDPTLPGCDNPNPAPEPETLALLCAGMLGLMIWRRRA
jgi:PEP-CTERM motif